MLGKYFKFLTKYILLMVLFLLGSGCATIPQLSSTDAESLYEAATEKYARYLRWGYIQDAAGFSRARDGSEIFIDLEDAMKYRVSNYTILSRLLADNGFEGRVLAFIEYYHVDSGILYHLDMEQNWWFDHVKEKWYISGPPPRFSDVIGNK